MDIQLQRDRLKVMIRELSQSAFDEGVAEASGASDREIKRTQNRVAMILKAIMKEIDK